MPYFIEPTVDLHTSLSGSLFCWHNSKVMGTKSKVTRVSHKYGFQTTAGGLATMLLHFKNTML